MALTQAQSQQVQAKLALEHKLSLSQIGKITEKEMQQLFNAIRDADDVTWARIIRRVMPEIITRNGLAAAALGVAYYDMSRKAYAMTDFAVKAAQKPYVATVQAFTESNVPRQLLDESMDRTGYFFGQAFRNETPTGLSLPDIHLQAPPEIKVPSLSPSQLAEIQATPLANEPLTISPFRQEQEGNLQRLAQRSAYNFSHETIKINMEIDGAAKSEEPYSVVSGTGCNFCKNVVFFRGKNENQRPFHDGCSCSPQPAWHNEVQARPEWADDFEEARDKAYNEIMEHNRGLTRHTREIIVERVNSKGKTVRERKTRYYYTDKNGKPAEVISMTDKNILNFMRRKG